MTVWPVVVAVERSGVDGNNLVKSGNANDAQRWCRTMPDFKGTTPKCLETFLALFYRYRSLSFHAFPWWVEGLDPLDVCKRSRIGATCA